MKTRLSIFICLGILLLVIAADGPVGIFQNSWTTNRPPRAVQGQDNLSVTNRGSGTNWQFYNVGPNTIARLTDISNAGNGLFIAIQGGAGNDNILTNSTLQSGVSIFSPNFGATFPFTVFQNMNDLVFVHPDIGTILQLTVGGLVVDAPALITGSITNTVLSPSKLVSSGTGTQFVSSAYSDTDIGNLQGATNGLNAAVQTKQAGSATLTNFSNLSNPSNPGIGFIMSGTTNGPIWISPDTGWWPVVDEEFIIDPTLQANGSTAGNFTRSFNGNVPSTVSSTIPYENGYVGIFFFWSTQSNSGINIYAGGTTAGQEQISCTNMEIFLSARIRIGITNTSTDLSSLAVGVGKTAGALAITSDPTDGIFIHSTTNNNCQFELITSRASSRTVSAAFGTAFQYAWTNVAFYMDATGTNVIAYLGSCATNLVPMVTNNAGVPNSVMVTPYVSGRRLLSSSGTANRTNYIDSYRLWVRRKQPLI